MEENQFIIFELSDQNYCVSIQDVSEILLYKNSMELPNTPDFVEGIINLRGDIVSVISLADRINKKSNIDKENQKIILTSRNSLKIGYLVDDIEGIMTVNSSQIFPAPPLVKNKNDRYISGVINKDENIIMVLDLNRMLNITELEVLEDFISE